MATNYHFDASSPIATTAANDHAVDLIIQDTVVVEQGGSITATGTGAYGISSLATGNLLTISGLVSSERATGIYLNGGSTITIEKTGVVYGHEAFYMNGSNVLWNAGEIKADGNNSSIINSSFSARDTFTLYNTGLIRGPIQGADGANLLINKGNIQGSISTGVSHDVYDGRGGFITQIINLGGGNDEAFGGSGSETFLGGAGNDIIDGGAGADTVTYTNGTMTIDLRRTDAQDLGTAGFDTLLNIENLTSTGQGNTNFVGSDADNELRSETGKDVLVGGLGNDSIFSGNNDDSLSGGQGNDTLDGGYAGADTLDGGDGFDKVVFSEAELNHEAVVVNMGDPADATNTQGADIYVGVEALVGTSLGDTFTGDANANTFTGGAGNDTLDGGAGVNTALFSGPAAAYTITKSNGVATIVDARANGDGTDQLKNIRFAQFTDKLVALINANPGQIALSASVAAENAGVNTIVSALSALDADGDAVEFSLVADSGGTFKIQGMNLVLAKPLDFETATKHTISVKASDIYGGEHIQQFTIDVTDVADTLIPSGTMPPAGSLVQRGTPNRDSLTGTAGKDALWGGAGLDIFVFDTKPNKKTNIDKIADFSVADDTIQLAKSVFSNIAKKGTLSKSAFWTGHDAKDASDRIGYDKKTGALYYDSDGNGVHAAVQIATLQKNLKGISNKDFFLI